MPGLVLKLAPKERLLINGAVIENGDRRCRLSVVTAGASILRLRDAIHPADANTPVKRACYEAQLLLTGDADPATAREGLLRRIEALSQALTDPDSRAALDEATEALMEDRHYRCLKALRRLIPRERRLLAVFHAPFRPGDGRTGEAPPRTENRAEERTETGSGGA